SFDIRSKFSNIFANRHFPPSRIRSKDKEPHPFRRQHRRPSNASPKVFPPPSPASISPPSEQLLKRTHLAPSTWPRNSPAPAFSTSTPSDIPPPPPPLPVPHAFSPPISTRARY